MAMARQNSQFRFPMFTAAGHNNNNKNSKNNHNNKDTEMSNRNNNDSDSDSDNDNDNNATRPGRVGAEQVQSSGYSRDLSNYQYYFGGSLLLL